MTSSTFDVAVGKIARALAQFIEQPRVLDGNDRLRREVLNQLNLFVGERAYLFAIDGHRT